MLKDGELMGFSPSQIQDIIQKRHPNSKLLKASELTGGVSAQMTALEIALPDKLTQQMILRQHGEADRKRNPNIAQDEYTLLSILRSIDLPVPEPYHVDTSHLLMEFIDGKTTFSPNDLESFIMQLAKNLVAIHQVDLTKHDLSFLPQQIDLIKHRIQSPPPSDRHIVDAMCDVIPSLPMNNTVLLHGDYWLGNILWREGQLVGIIDWEDAMLGDPLGDLGKSRLEMIWTLDEDAMNTYTQHYQKLMPLIDFSYLPFWDLWGALRLASFADWFDDAEKVTKIQGLYDEFVDYAIRQLEALEK
jgi:aminoglycoside phosphotransferase (APT) family kinase protein